MKLSRAFVALVLFSLSIALGAELVLEGRGSFHEAEEVLSTKAAGGAGQVALLPVSSPEESSAPCADPCHYGQSHFGHCLAVLVGIILPAQPSAVGYRFVKAGPPFRELGLSGLRRPPRASRA